MNIKEKHKDLGSGLIFIMIGVLFFYLCDGLQMGTLNKMGPAYFPTSISLLLILLGCGLVLRSLSWKY